MTKAAKSVRSDAKSNFGKKGWLMTLYLFLGFFLATSLGSDLLNIYVPAFAAEHGWDIAVMYGIVTISGLISVVAVIILGFVIRKTGARAMAIVGLIINIVIMLLRPHVTSLWQYNVLFIVNNICLQAVVYISAGTLTANWFPRKKGLVMGWATMGAATSTIAAAYIFNAMLNSSGGIVLAFSAWTVIPIVMLLMALFFIRNNPEECGYNPDNDTSMTPEVAAKLLREGQNYEKTSPWSIRRLLTSRAAWCSSLGTGPLLMLSVGIMSSLVTRAISVGFTMEQGILIMSVSAIVGLAGSYLAGVIDTKVGTRAVTVMLYVWIIIALALNLLSEVSIVFFYISVIMMATFIGGANNMPMSMISTVFGRFDFSSAYRVCWPINVIIQSFGFSLVGALAARMGNSFTASYVLLIVASVIGIIFTLLTPKHCVGRN